MLIKSGPDAYTFPMKNLSKLMISCWIHESDFHQFWKQKHPQQCNGHQMWFALPEFQGAAPPNPLCALHCRRVAGGNLPEVLQQIPPAAMSPRAGNVWSATHARACIGTTWHFLSHPCDTPWAVWHTSQTFSVHTLTILRSRTFECVYANYGCKHLMCVYTYIVCAHI
jgi:hypothetical protein